MFNLIFGALLIVVSFFVKMLPEALLPVKYKQVAKWGMTGFGTFIIIWGAVFIADSNKSYVVQFPNGTMHVVTEPGVSWQLYGKKYEYDRVVAVSTPMFVRENNVRDGDDEIESSSEQFDTVNSLTPPTVRFTDAAKATFYGITRAALPTTYDGMLLIHREFGSDEALINNLLKPTFNSVAISSARLMSIQDYITKRGSDFDEYFSDQFKNGLYKTNVTQEVIITAGAGTATTIDLKGEELVKNQDKNVKQKTQQIQEVVTIVIDENGVPVRQGINDISRYGLNVITARVTYVDPEQKVRDLIGKQRDAEAAASLAENDKRKSLLEAEAAKAEGTKKVAVEEASALVRQIKMTTEAETEKKIVTIKAQQQLEVARLQKKTAGENLSRDRIRAKSVTVLADAEAYKKREILKADNALKDKLDAWKYAQDKWAAAYSVRKVPTWLSGGGAGGSGHSDSSVQDFMSLLSLNAAKQLDLDIGIKK